jgi:hypothetical protein
MGLDTVFPEIAMGFAETIAHAVEIGEAKQWRDEDIPLIIAVCRYARQKFESRREQLRQVVLNGVDVRGFVAQGEPQLLRLESLLQECVRTRATAGPMEGTSIESPELAAELEALGEAVDRFRDLLQKALAAMQAPRQPLDWERVRQAQAAYREGETKPLERSPQPGGE